MKISSRYSLIIFIIFLMGCSSTQVTTETILTLTPFPTSTIAITPTQLTHTKTPAFTPIPDLTHLNIDCIDVVNEIPSNIDLNGTLVFDGASKESYLLNLRNNQYTSIGTKIANLTVSPNNQRLAYIDFGRDILVISDVNGNTIKTIDGFNDQFSLVEWLDNENLAINKAREKQPPFLNFSLVVLNSYTSETNEFEIENYPNSQKLYKTFWNYLGRLVPNHQLTKTIYTTGEAGMPISLWDLNSNTEIKKIYLMDTITPPKWSSDGTKLLVSVRLKHQSYSNFEDDLPFAGGSDLFVVSDIGELKRLTFLSTEYKDNSFIEYTWSPQEDKVVFWLGLGEKSGLQLAVLDTQTDEVTNLCISADGENPENTSSWSDLIWSPDGKQLAFTQWGIRSQSVFIVDFENMLAIKIADNAVAEGWMINK